MTFKLKLDTIGLMKSKKEKKDIFLPDNLLSDEEIQDLLPELSYNYLITIPPFSLMTETRLVTLLKGYENKILKLNDQEEIQFYRKQIAEINVCLKTKKFIVDDYFTDIPLIPGNDFASYNTILLKPTTTNNHHTIDKLIFVFTEAVSVYTVEKLKIFLFKTIKDDKHYFVFQRGYFNNRDNEYNLNKTSYFIEWKLDINEMVIEQIVDYLLNTHINIYLNDEVGQAGIRKTLYLKNGFTDVMYQWWNDGSDENTIKINRLGIFLKELAVKEFFKQELHKRIRLYVMSPGYSSHEEYVEYEKDNIFVPINRYTNSIYIATRLIDKGMAPEEASSICQLDSSVAKFIRDILEDKA